MMEPISALAGVLVGGLTIILTYKYRRNAKHEEQHSRLDEFENRLAVTQQRCDELVAGQE